MVIVIVLKYSFLYRVIRTANNHTPSLSIFELEIFRNAKYFNKKYKFLGGKIKIRIDCIASGLVEWKYRLGLYAYFFPVIFISVLLNTHGSDAKRNEFTAPRSMLWKSKTCGNSSKPERRTDRHERFTKR